MKRLLLSMLLLIPVSAYAACEVTFNTVGTFDGGKNGQKITQTTKWDGLAGKAEIDFIYSTGQKVVDTASKEQGKAKAGEGHELEMSRVANCEADSRPAEGIRVEGLTWQGVNKVDNEAQKQMSELMKAGDAHVAKGNKTGWGK